MLNTSIRNKRARGYNKVHTYMFVIKVSAPSSVGIVPVRAFNRKSLCNPARKCQRWQIQAYGALLLRSLRICTQLRPPHANLREIRPGGQSECRERFRGLLSIIFHPHHLRQQDTGHWPPLAYIPSGHTSMPYIVFSVDIPSITN